MSEEQDCVVKLVDSHGVEHSVKVRAESVYEAALRGLQKLEQVGWESDGSQIGTVTVEVWETRAVSGRLRDKTEEERRAVTLYISSLMKAKDSEQKAPPKP